MGTTLYSTIYYGAAVVVVLLAVRWLTSVWKHYSQLTNDDMSDNRALSMPANKPIVKTVAIVVGLIVVLVGGWNIKQSLTTNISTYQNPAELSDQKKVEESQLPTQEQMDQKRVEQKEKQDIKPQKDAFDSFDEQMKQEAQKIRDRNNSTPKEAEQTQEHNK